MPITHTLAPHTRTPGDLEIRKDSISGVGIGGGVSRLCTFIQLLKEEQSAQGKSEYLLHATNKTALNSAQLHVALP
jgi:histidyl-tRNA synthetase